MRGRLHTTTKLAVAGTNFTKANAYFQSLEYFCIGFDKKAF